MKHCLYIIIIGVVIWLGIKLQPNAFLVNDSLSFIMAVIAYGIVSAYLAALITSLLSSFISTELDKNNALTVTVMCSFVILITSVISLIAVETVVPNFQIIGFLPKIIVAFVTTLLISTINYCELSQQ